ncbi:MAG: class I SAM-dependent RNA methyltransferase [Clostridia bacterium]|nr:class I SAM-dependent RNA methyltransferase [Clostridia bacterium]
MRFIATCKLGLESVVTRELRGLGLEVEATCDARVYFSGGFEAMIRALLWLRTAERVLLVAGEFQAGSFDALFEGTRALDWKRFLRPDSNIHVNGKSAKSALFSVSDCQRIVKKAIIENLKRAYHREDIPEGGREVIVEIGMLRETATLALDCCGAGLARRGYRTYNVAAPLSETLGAAVLLLSRYRPDRPLIDPMCGSGTMPIEAAMIAANIAPGRGRRFAAEDWHFTEPALWRAAREEAADAARPSCAEICGYDIDPRCIELCKKHAKKAGVMLDWRVQPLSALQSERQNGLVVCNPPYGERLLDEAEAAALYREMRAVFDRLPGWSVSVISGMRNFERAYGRRADRRRKLSNGGMSCQLYQYFRGRPL